MNVLLLGSGGREHALAWKIRQSRELTHLYIAPGNAGTASVGQNVPISVTDFAAIKKFSLENDIDMIAIGPEDRWFREFTTIFSKVRCYLMINILI
jgi:phosphoribosylamine--glycine ligase